MTTEAPQPDDLDELATLNAELSELETRIHVVKSRIADREKVRNVDKLAEVRADLREKTALYARVKTAVLAQREERANARARLLRDQEAIAESSRLRPPVATYLPNDPEVLRWQKGHEALLVARTKHQAEHDALPDPEVTAQEVAGYEGITGVLAHLQLAERNLLDRLEGKSWRAGLVSTV